MDKQKISIVILSIVLLFSLIFVYYQHSKIDALNVVINTQSNIIKVEKDKVIVDNNNEKLKLLLKDRVDAHKKIESLEQQLIKLRGSKPNRESIHNEIKSYSIDSIAKFFNDAGYNNEVLRRDGNIFQLQYSSKVSR
jgi:hypothetical protein